MSWTPDSWQAYPTEQQAEYLDQQALVSVIEEINQLPPLVSKDEVLSLKADVAAAAQGERFILQGGDCAESFSDCNQESISRKISLLNQMSLILGFGLSKPITQVGRMAGQYAKPRSNYLETKQSQSLPSYRGDLINGIEFTALSRTPDPQRLLKGYSLASLTLNFIRTQNARPFDPASLFGLNEQSQSDSLSHLPQELNTQIEALVQALKLHQQLSGQQSVIHSPFYTCHEALHLLYEQSLTRKSHDQWFNLSTHMPWVGMRTAKPNSAHIEYLKGIENPIGIKVGPRMTKEWLTEIIGFLNPNNEKGRVSLITRFGSKGVTKCLPDLIEAIGKTKLNVTWICDPMHGNTLITDHGIKTRYLADILSELDLTQTTLANHSIPLGGIHLELSGDLVNECLSSNGWFDHSSQRLGYRSLVDPRLNPVQAIELMLRWVQKTKLKKKGTIYSTQRLL